MYQLWRLSSLEFELLSSQSEQHISALISAWSCRPITTPGRTVQFFRPSQAYVLQLSLSPSRCFTTDPFSPAFIWNHNKRAWQILRSNWNLRLCLSVSILASVYKHSWPEHPPINPPPRLIPPKPSTLAKAEILGVVQTHTHTHSIKRIACLDLIAIFTKGCDDYC